MLGPPVQKQEEGVVETFAKARPQKAEHFLPGLPADPKTAAIYHCSGAKDVEDHFCLASNVKGKRCKRKRTNGNYCKQHAHEVSKPDRQEALWEALAKPLQSAAERWDKEQMDMALALSLESSAEVQEKMESSRQRIELRLADFDLELVPTAGDGSCQFVAVLFSAGIPLDVQDFRAQVVHYLRSLPELFETKIDSSFRSFSTYCDALARPSAWGDELSLCAMAHLLMRPITCFADNEAEDVRHFLPPPLISEEVWGDPIYICHIMNNHFDATAPLPKELPRASNETVKLEKPKA